MQEMITQGPAAAAGAVALALGAGVVMSALAIDLTDAAVASAILAAGACMLVALPSYCYAELCMLGLTVSLKAWHREGIG